MTRRIREFSNSNVYHIIFRGNDRQDIFYDDQDRYVFLDNLKETKNKFNYKVYAYCLMSNHVHIIIRVEDKFLSKSMQSLEIRYLSYFNKKINRSGHLFEGRFFSKRVENVEYFKDVCKYVHRNPEKAGIDKTENYKWSSFQEYVSGKENIIDKSVLLHYFNNNVEELKKFFLENDDKKQLYNFAEFELRSKLSEEELGYIIKERFNLKNASDVSLLNKEDMNSVIKYLKGIQGTSLAQIARVTKVTAYYIKKVWK